MNPGPTINKIKYMKKLLLILTLVPTLAFAGGTLTPRFGGGYNYEAFDGQNGITTGTVTPRFGGGYDVNTFNPNMGYTHETITPRFGGGYNINH
jgi:hypothetical protein